MDLYHLNGNNLSVRAMQYASIFDTNKLCLHVVELFPSSKGYYIQQVYVLSLLERNAHWNLQLHSLTTSYGRLGKLSIKHQKREKKRDVKGCFPVLKGSKMGKLTPAGSTSDPIKNGSRHTNHSTIERPSARQLIDTDWRRYCLQQNEATDHQPLCAFGMLEISTTMKALNLQGYASAKLGLFSPNISSWGYTDLIEQCQAVSLWVGF